MKLSLALKAVVGKLKYAALLVVVPCALAAPSFQNLYSFTRTNYRSWSPRAGLVADGSGNLYGTTAYGGVYDCGTVFKLSPHIDGTWAENVLYSFTCSKDGWYPAANLIFDQAGNLYGTTQGYSTVSYGNVFELVHQKNDSWPLKVLHSFSGGSDGANPLAGLILDQAGNLYGTTSKGGASYRGVIFELKSNGRGSWKEKVLHSFAGGSDGDTPMATLTFDSSGNFYGTTEYGGGLPPCGSCGTVFQLIPQRNGEWKYQMIHRFRGTDGYDPLASVTLDAAGNLYGTTSGGGPKGAGTVFELVRGQKGSWTRKSLHNFGLNLLAGTNPWTALLFDKSGNLWGTTIGGGNLGCNGGCGVVFKLTPGAQGQWNESVVHTFVGNPGYYPAGTLISDPAGNLYGTSEGDGMFTFGSVYEITP